MSKHNIKTVSDVVETNDETLVIFTRGNKLIIDFDNESVTGKWNAKPAGKIKKVIIYHRQDNINVYNNIYVGDFVRIENTDEENRSDVVFKNVMSLGQTKSDWHEFLKSKTTSPVVYV